MAADELTSSHRARKAGSTMKKKSENDKKKRGVSDNKQPNPCNLLEIGKLFTL